jgi:hypothetical protein
MLLVFWRKVLTTLALLMVIIMACEGCATATATPAPTTSMSYATIGNQALTNMLRDFYTNGRWKTCLACGAFNQDWGDDAMTNALWLRWTTNHHDASVIAPLQALAHTAPSYGPPCKSPQPCNQWSDVPMWDAVALGHEFEATGANNPTILAKAVAAFNTVDGAGPSVYAPGACPTIHYQQPGGGANKLKTLETDANYIKAALLLESLTHVSTYLTKAEHAYAAVRQYFLDPALALYSVYVFDNGTTCTQERGRFFASVNGTMISNGLTLASLTGNATYRVEALATGQAVADHLSDARGVFTDLQAENDIVEPLIEAMFTLAATEQQGFAAQWLQAAASAAASSLQPSGAYSRIFDGPANPGSITIWQANGGYALAFAEAALHPHGTPTTTRAWATATNHVVDITTSTLPASITFTGTGIALIGTLGEDCCEAGHARVFIDGTETTDTTGIWQNKSSAGHAIPNTVLFAWRWRTPGTHTITLDNGIANGKEGGSFIHIQAYLVDP